MRRTPQVSVVTPVYNGAAWLPKLAPQIFGQSMGDFEWIIVNDGSSDSSGEIIKDLARSDPRVRLLSPGRIGFVPALNLAVEEARAELIARQDVDDSSRVERLRLQLDFMRAHPEVGVLGGYSELVHMERNERFIRRPPGDHARLLRTLPVGIPFAHTVIMFRREAWRAAGGYKPVLCGEDLLLWIEMAQHGWQLASLPEVLGSHVVHSESFFFSNFGYPRMMRTMARIHALAIYRLGLPWWMYVYPLARLSYAYLPNGLKRLLRRQIISEVDDKTLAPVLQ